MSKNGVHDFHLVMDRGMIEKLTDLECFKDFRGLSGVIVRILHLLSPIVKREHVWGEQRMSRYKAVCTDPDEVRKDVHVYLASELYRELKLMHQDLNYYSIAQMVRDFLCWFLGFVGVCKGDVLEELKDMFSQWVEEKESTRLSLCEYVRQLFRIVRHLPGRSRLVNIYNSDYSPFWIMRM